MVNHSKSLYTVEYLLEIIFFPPYAVDTGCRIESGIRISDTSLKQSTGARFTKSFRRWITHEVLPSIRRNGYYSLAEREVPFTNGEVIITIPRLNEAAQGVKAAMIMARAFGYRDAEARRLANGLVKKITGIDALELLDAPAPKYFEEDGTLFKEFLAENCVDDESSSVNSTALYEAFKKWCA